MVGRLSRPHRMPRIFLKSSPATGPEGTHFVRHATLIAYVFAPIYALAQRAETLLVLQATLLGSAVIPLFAFAAGYRFLIAGAGRRALALRRAVEIEQGGGASTKGAM